MYVVDFFKRMTRKSNVPVLIYLVLNVVIICVIMYALFGQSGDIPGWATVLLGLALYAVSLTIALSPLGEWLLRYQNGCKKITRIEYIEYLEPLFNEVYDRAKQMDPTLPDDVELYMNSDTSANAFATGRRTICVTEGLLELPPEQIKATLGHEFGHLAHKDTDLILVVTVGNMIVTGLIMFLKIIIDIVHFFLGIGAALTGGSEGLLGVLAAAVSRFLVSIFVSGLMWLWTKLGTALVMKSSRDNEFEADEFSFNLGYGDDLCALLDVIGGPAPQGLFATLASSHPDKHERISHLQELGASYRASIGYQGRTGSALPSQQEAVRLPRSAQTPRMQSAGARQTRQPQAAFSEQAAEPWQPPRQQTENRRTATRAKKIPTGSSADGREGRKSSLGDWTQKVQAGAGAAMKKASDAAEKAKTAAETRRQQSSSRPTATLQEPDKEKDAYPACHVASASRTRSARVPGQSAQTERPARHAAPSSQTPRSTEQNIEIPEERHVSRNTSEETPIRRAAKKPVAPAEPDFSTDELDFDLESILNEFK